MYMIYRVNRHNPMGITLPWAVNLMKLTKFQNLDTLNEVSWMNSKRVYKASCVHAGFGLLSR